MKPLTPKQQIIFDFIQAAVEENQVPPSLREIGSALDLSVGTVQDQVEAIRRKGYLEKEQTKARGIRLPMSANQVPVLGRVHAGPLHLALENVEGHLPVGKTLSPSKHFALRIQGDSMIDAGILEGDMVIVRMQPVAEDGDIVVARVEDDATVKRFRKQGSQVFLEPANSQYSPIVDTPFSLVGVVVEVRRQLQKK